MLLENEKSYNTQFTEYFKYYFQDLNSFKNFENIKIENISDDFNNIKLAKAIQTEIIDKCKLFIKNK